MPDYLKYWKKEQVDIHNRLEPTLVHSGSGQHDRINIGDTVWIVTIRRGEMSLIGRIIVGEIINHEEAIERYGENVYDSPVHIVAAPGTEEQNREINIMDIAIELRFDTVPKGHRQILRW